MACDKLVNPSVPVEELTEFSNALLLAEKNLNSEPCYFFESEWDLLDEE